MHESKDTSIIEDTSQSEVIENDISHTTEHSNKENSNANINSPQIPSSSPKTIYTKLSEQMMNNFLKTGKFTYNYDTLVNTKDTNNGSKTSKNKKIISKFLERNANNNMKRVLPFSFSQKNGIVKTKLSTRANDKRKSMKEVRSPEKYQEDQMKFLEAKKQRIEEQRKQLTNIVMNQIKPKPSIDKKSKEIASKVSQNKDTCTRLFEERPKRAMKTISKDKKIQKKKKLATNHSQKQISECVSKLYKESVERTKMRSQSNIPLHMEKVSLFYSRDFANYNSNIRTNAKKDMFNTNELSGSMSATNLISTKKNKMLIIDRILQEINECNIDKMNFWKLCKTLFKLGYANNDHTLIMKIITKKSIEECNDINFYNEEGIDEAIDDLIKNNKTLVRFHNDKLTKTILNEELNNIKQIFILLYNKFNSNNKVDINSNMMIDVKYFKLFLLIINGLYNGSSSPMSSNDDNARTISVKESPLITKSKLISNHNLGKKTKSTNTLNSSSSCNVVTAIDYYIDKKINNNIKIKVKDAKAIKTAFEQFVENRKRYDNMNKKEKRLIASKSKSNFSFKPKIESNKGESTKLEETYFIIQQRHMNQIEQLQKEKINKELKECTFAPNNKKVDRSKSIEISNRLYNVCKRKKTENINSSVFNDKECTFTPKTNSKLKEEIFTINPIKDDPLYNFKVEQYEKARIEKKLINFISCQGGTSITKLKNSDELLKEFQNQPNYENFKFGLEKKTNKDTFDKFNNNTNYMNGLTSPSKKELPLFTIEVKIKDRIEFLDYYQNDDPTTITNKFCKRHGLGESSNEKILAVIEDKLKSNDLNEVSESNNS